MTLCTAPLPGSGRDSAKNAKSKSTGQTSSAAISTKTVDGNTVIVYQGREFPVGKTQGRITTKASSIQGKDYAAAFDGDRVIWESVPGAAKQLK